jgi:Cytochrome b5-like Heme/Steroid binding domain/Bacterial Ig-like domain (group 2)
LRKFLIPFLLTFAQLFAQTPLPNYTLADVAKHATATDCWMVLYTNQVYDFTKYITQHPGGQATFLLSCGTNGSSRFAAVSHSSAASALHAQYLIGNLVASQPPPAVSVTIAPATISVQSGSSQTFTATTANSTQGVTWTATSLIGTVDVAGKFSASTPGSGVVTATSIEDTSKFASAQVTVTPLPPPPPPAIAVTIAPISASATVGQTKQFKGTATNSSQGVTYTVTNSIGTIDSNGTFTATTPGAGVVRAVSVQDSTKFAAASVTVAGVPPPPPPPSPVVITVMPATATISMGQKQQYTASVQNSSQGVTWSVLGNVGTIDYNGVFTATAAGAGSVEATSVQDKTKTAVAAVIVKAGTPPPSTGGCTVSKLLTRSAGFSVACPPTTVVPAGTYSCKGTNGSNGLTLSCTASRRESDD